jgi:hypothetical protein
MLREGGNAWRRSGRDQCANFVHLMVPKRDGDFLGRHTKDHTMQIGPMRYELRPYRATPGNCQHASEPGLQVAIGPPMRAGLAGSSARTAVCAFSINLPFDVSRHETRPDRQ